MAAFFNGLRTLLISRRRSKEKSTSQGDKALSASEIKFGTVETGDDDLMASFEALTRLGERLDGPYRLAAAYLRNRLEVTPSARLRRRDALYLELRRRWYSDASNNKAAAAISQELMRYEASAWRRRECQFSEPPVGAIGTARELFWRILKESDGGAVGRARLRQLFDAAPIVTNRRLPINRRSALQLGLDTRGERNALNASPNFELIVRQLPGFQVAASKAHAEEIAARQTHIDEIAKLDSAAAKAWPRQEKQKAESLGKSNDAHRAWQLALAEHQRVLADVTSERFAYERERNEHEAALTSGVWPEIDGFLEQCDREIERTLAARAVRGFNVKGKHLEFANGRSVGERAGAIRASMREADRLKLIADRRQIPDAIAKIAEGWPRVRDPSPPEAAA